MNVCKKIVYSGRVQGVGFRYTACRLAEGRAVAGYVRNLPNGKVELVAEGDETEVQGFLEAIANRMGDHVQDCNSVDIPPLQAQGFVIRT